MNTYIDQIRKIIKSKVEYKAKIMATEFRDEMYNEAKCAIQDFYDDYDPIIYKRHTIEQNFATRSFKKYYAKVGSVYYAGIDLTWRYFSGRYQDSYEEVFDSVYSGFHGPASIYTAGWNVLGEQPRAFRPVPRTYPSPMKRLLDKKKKLIEKYTG